MAPRTLTGAIVSCLALAWLAEPPAVAQGASAAGNVNQNEERFEAVSIRPSASIGDRVSGGVQPSGRVALRGATPYWLILFSYNGFFPAERIAGEPAWSRNERYDIEATAARQPKDVRVLLQNMLRDRFQLRAHSEIREIPIYALILARSDGKLGSRLRRASVDCADQAAVDKAEGEKKAGEFVCRGRAGANSLSFRGLQIRNLVSALGGRVERPVIDRTGLLGYFDIDLDWAPTLEAAGVPDLERVSIFTAVQEQLGLRLQADSAVQDILVVDSLERPSEN
jgi:uncharacterized protein (TIGR03435 family)